MVTPSKAALALILMALVGCGPKPALHLNDMTPATNVYKIDGLCPPTTDLVCPPDTRIICDNDQKYKCWPFDKPLPWANTMVEAPDKPYSIGWDAHGDSPKWRLADEPPSIDANPYRFIGGQRYGEGWGGKRIQRDAPPLNQSATTMRSVGCMGCISDAGSTYCNYCDGGPFLPLE